MNEVPSVVYALAFIYQRAERASESGTREYCHDLGAQSYVGRSRSTYFKPARENNDSLLAVLVMNLHEQM